MQYLRGAAAEKNEAPLPPRAQLACHSQHGRRCADGSRTELSRSRLPRTSKDINSGGRIEGEEQHCIDPRPTVGGTDGVNGQWVNSWESSASYLKRKMLQKLLSLGCRIERLIVPYWLFQLEAWLKVHR
jgi:hypothetical protein